VEKSGVVKNKLWRVKLAMLILLSLIIIIFVIDYFKNDKKYTMVTTGSVKGILKNKQGMPVADAAVMIKEGSHEFNDMASISNEQGEFFVSGIAIPGRYVLQINHSSGTTTKEINVQSADTVIVINL
jgi:hypothetical protein